MKISYVVRDARTCRVDPGWAADQFDLQYYRGLLEKAWREISYAFRWEGQESCGEWKAQKDLEASGCYETVSDGVKDT
jgi:hypothetical protein